MGLYWFRGTMQGKLRVVEGQSGHKGDEQLAVGSGRAEGSYVLGGVQELNIAEFRPESLNVKSWRKMRQSGPRDCRFVAVIEDLFRLQDYILVIWTKQRSLMFRRQMAVVLDEFR